MAGNGQPRRGNAGHGEASAALHTVLASNTTMTKRQRRPSAAIWQQLRQQVWERDGGRCQGPYCRAAPPLALDVVHIDHRIPLARGGTNELGNLRTLCRRCHVLRADHTHQGMVAQALRDGIIPPDWRALVWDDAPAHTDDNQHQPGES